MTDDEIRALLDACKFRSDSEAKAITDLANAALEARAELATVEGALAKVLERGFALRDAGKHFSEWDHCYPGNISLELVFSHVSNAVDAWDAALQSTPAQKERSDE